MKRRTQKSRPVASVQKYIAMLQPTRSPNTCRLNRYQLQGFHRWLKINQLDVTELNREHITHWLVYRTEQGLSATTRREEIITVRIYLHWLHEQGIVDTNPDELIRKTDLPKLPKYLPRPLSPQIDQQLQKRLQRSPKPVHKALLLTRKAGLRIGELIDLQYDCIRTDFQGRQFLKVPLGKLNNERLVPMDDATVKLVDNLRKRGYKPRQFLMATATGQRTKYHRYTYALSTICQGLDIPDRMTLHRLRHTFATSLLSAGMSLPSLMKLLGHRDWRMTLRYAEITQEAVGKEYFEALTEIENRYHAQLHCKQADLFNPIKSIGDVIRWLRTNIAPDASSKNFARLLIRRLERARKEIAALRARKVK
jgi:site-specific recombinase XerD